MGVESISDVCIVSGGIEWKSTQPNNKINHSKEKMCCLYHWSNCINEYD